MAIVAMKKVLGNQDWEVDYLQEVSRHVLGLSLT